jgi:hypothetical protein
MFNGNLGLIELLLSGAIGLGFCAWQWWGVRDAGKPPKSDDSSRHPKG